MTPATQPTAVSQDIKKFKLGLHYALEFYTSQQQRRASGAGRTPTGRGSSSGGFVRSEGWGAEPGQLEQWVMSLMLGHVAAVLQEAAEAASKLAQAQQHTVQAPLPQQQQQQKQLEEVSSAARIAMCACLLLARPSVLWERVFPLFAAAKQPRGALGAMLEVLEPAIVADAFEMLPPEVMHALVEHFAAAGQPGRVERCVLHINVLSLDLDQVIRLCEAHKLYSALVYVHNRIHDYRRPLLDLLAAVAAGMGNPWAAAAAAAAASGEAGAAAAPAPAAGGERQVAAACGYKLLVYLRGVFRGEAFPPGSGLMIGWVH